MVYHKKNTNLLKYSIILLIITSIALYSDQKLKKLQTIVFNSWISVIKQVNLSLDFIKDSLHRINLLYDSHLENIILKEKVKLLESQLYLITDYQNEINNLKEALNYKPKGFVKIITTPLIGVKSNNFVQEAYISLGKSDGIELNQSVMFKNYLIGTISEVHNNYSKILLIFDSRFKVSAITLESKYNIVAKGNNNLLLNLLYLPNNSNLVPNESILVSNYSTLYKSGLKIGYVTHYKDRYFISVPYKLSDIELVNIVS